MKAMILAAGRGERMRPLTDHTPKPMLKAGGQPLIVWHLRRLAAAGFREIVINHAHLGQVIEAGLGDGSAYGVRIRYSAEAEALETAGGIALALPLLGDAPFLVVNGDIHTDFDFGRAWSIVGQMKAGDLLGWCVVTDNPGHHPQGDFVLDTGRLSRSVPTAATETTGAAAPTNTASTVSCTDATPWTFSGIGIYQPALFASIEPGRRAALAPLLSAAAAAGRLGGERLLGRWTDVGTPGRLAELDAQLNGLPNRTDRNEQ